MSDDKPIIIIKKGGGHGGHHGGAWKVAYADFVTAMMAFFMVMWLVNSADVATRQSIASYFRRPGLFSEGSGTPLEIGDAGILNDAYAPMKPEGDSGTGRRDAYIKTGTPPPTPKVRVTPIKKDLATEQERPYTLKELREAMKNRQYIEQIADEAKRAEEAEKTMQIQRDYQRKRLNDVAERIKQSFASAPDLAKLLGLVKVRIEGDGLHIDIMDTEKESMFQLGSAGILPEAREAFLRLGEALKPLKNDIEIVGHTDAKPFASRRGGYSNWELSADRANSARKLLLTAGVAPNRIVSVVGKADRELLNKEDPFAASNRRITLKLRFGFEQIKTIDFEEEPDALNEVDISRSLEELNPVDSVSSPALPNIVTPTPVPDSDSDDLLQYSPKKLIKAAKESNKTVELPKPGEANESKKPNLIFDESPVLGPGDPFSDF